MGGLALSEILNALVFLGIFSLVIMGILLFYNGFTLLYFICKSKYNKSNTQYEYKEIIHYKSNITILMPFILLLSLIMFLYYTPVSFDKIMGSKNFISQNPTIHVLGSRDFSSEIVFGKVIEDKTEVLGVINILNGYKYRRSVGESRIGNTNFPLGDVELISIDIAMEGVNRSATLTITSEGYVYDASSGQAYKVLAVNKGELVDRLRESKLLENK